MGLQLFSAASRESRGIMENKLQRCRGDGCVTQILVAGSPLSPQFHCAYRSILAGPYLAGGTDLKSSAATPSPPAPSNPLLFSLVATFLSLPLTLPPLGRAPSSFSSSYSCPASFLASTKSNLWTSIAIIFFLPPDFTGSGSSESSSSAILSRRSLWFSLLASEMILE